MELWQEVFRVLKPGGYLLAFSAARTYHHLATNIESVGFEIKDQIVWIYSSGFPKSSDIGKAIDKQKGKKDPNYVGTDEGNGNKTSTGLVMPSGRRCKKCNKDVTYQNKCKDESCGLRYTPQDEEAKQWYGWGTALKPGHEPIVMARKPAKQSIVKNVQKHGTGALNIDGCRIPYEDENDKERRLNCKPNPTSGIKNRFRESEGGMNKDYKGEEFASADPSKGRYPSNVIGEITDYQKYFYCPKVSRKERHTGFDTTQIPTDPSGMLKVTENGSIDDPYVDRREKRLANGNNHPTVKPVALMAYLVRLVTPPGGHVLDPFNGSGSTGMAAKQEGMEYTGIDLDQKYIDISKRRIDAWDEPPAPSYKKVEYTGALAYTKDTFANTNPEAYADKTGPRKAKPDKTVFNELFDSGDNVSQ